MAEKSGLLSNYCLGTLIAVCIGFAQVDEASSVPLNLLFMGNSHTYYYELQGFVGALAVVDGYDTPVIVLYKTWARIAGHSESEWIAAQGWDDSVTTAPPPAAVWLFGSAVAGLIALRAKR